MTRATILSRILGDDGSLATRISTLKNRIAQLDASILGLEYRLQQATSSYNELSQQYPRAFTQAQRTQIGTQMGSLRASINTMNTQLDTDKSERSVAQSSLSQLEDTYANQQAAESAMTAKTAVVEQAQTFISQGEKSGMVKLGFLGALAIGGWWIWRRS